MDQSFLDSLKGLPVEEAEKRAMEAGHKVFIVPEAADAISLIARPNTVILWQKDNKVRLSEAGDPTEVKGVG